MDFFEQTVAVKYLTDPLWHEHQIACKRIADGPTGSMKMIVENSAFEWMNSLREVIKVLSAKHILLQMKFTLYIGPEQGLSEAQLVDEDAKAFMPYKLAMNIVKQRVSSMLWHQNFPAAAVQLVSHSEAAQQRGLEQLNAEVQAVAWAREHGGKVGLDMAEKSMLNGELMQELMTLCAAVDYKEVPTAADRLVRDIFGGFNNTLINERANQRLRDVEQRQGARKSVARMSRWNHLVSGDLLASHKWPALEATTHCPTPTNDYMDTWFEHKQAAQMDTELSRIMGIQDTKFRTHFFNRRRV